MGFADVRGASKSLNAFPIAARRLAAHSLRCFNTGPEAGTASFGSSESQASTGTVPSRFSQAFNQAFHPSLKYLALLQTANGSRKACNMLCG